MVEFRISGLRVTYIGGSVAFRWRLEEWAVREAFLPTESCAVLLASIHERITWPNLRCLSEPRLGVFLFAVIALQPVLSPYIEMRGSI